MRIATIALATLLPLACAAPGAGGGAGAVTDVRGERALYESGGQTFRGYLAWDAARSGPRPGVLIVHEWWGHNEYVRSRARMLAELGYTALAVDMFGRGKQATHPTDAQTFMREVLDSADAGRARFEAALATLQAHEATDPERIAAIGYCFGGGIVLNMARAGLDLDGVASFHGSLSATAPAAPGSVKARLLVLHGGDDPLVSRLQVEQFRDEMATAGVELDFVTYPGARHAFTNPEATRLGQEFGLPLAYDEQADADSWARLQRFLTDLFEEG